MYEIIKLLFNAFVQARSIARPWVPISSPLTQLVYILPFLGKIRFALLLYVQSVVVVRHKLSGLIVSRMVRPRITKYYTYIHTDMVYSNNGYDVTDYLHSEVIAKKPSQMPPPTTKSYHPFAGLRWT